ncbi:hypothetical protein IG631_16945 [Alternaria alternata]|nr:hypothetical protein IG631_16945 [Alternaria alternata]
MKENASLDEEITSNMYHQVFLQPVAASEVTLTPARVLVSSNSANNHREAEVTRKNKKQAAATVAMNE